ncbi:MAG TPA: protease pro-enzyme activation domain-containing protein [Verrucomicrobiae bacterium]|nr:protease pro-enzyme activation domain-containing protein [Verrucomicrobiae bacterium]
MRYVRSLSSATARATLLVTVTAACLPAQTRITRTIDDTRLHRLAGNTRPEATAANDLGAAPDSLALEHMILVLQRSPEQETALDNLIADLHNPSSPSYHQWLTPAEFGRSFGPSQEDVAKLESWLQSHGFTVNSISEGRGVIDFSGTVEHVRGAFHTEMHYLNAGGQRHLANMTDPQIPEALAPVVAGVVSLHDFSPRSMKRAHANLTYTSGGTSFQALTPEDLATIYNMSPAFAAGYTGKNQTIAVIEDTNLYSTTDWTTFRSTFGLSSHTGGSLATVHPPASGVACGSPGVNSDDSEAILDAEWASAAAPDAAIQVASCASTRTTFGGYIALVNLVNSATHPNIISFSYGECEALNGASSNAAFANAYQQAVAEGISVFVAAGDEGGASCDAGATGATHGIGVSAFSSTPYNVAAGGTDFSDTFNNSVSTYWNTTNDASFGSAKSYIPEIPWNDSCASGLISSFLGFPTVYGTSGFCGSSTARQDGLLQVAAGSGGPSGCATGTPSTSGVVGGTCKGYAKPSWQAGVSGNPADGVRDIPDVSLFSGTGVWGHYYVVCYSDRRNGGTPCSGNPSGWYGAGGTSFAAPILAGIQALVNQKTGSAQGNPNAHYYALAASTTCLSNNGDSATSSCVFHNVTKGDNAVNCSGSDSCFGAAAATSGGGGRHGGFGGGGGGGSSSFNGALSTSTSSYTPAFSAASGWNFATGLGSLNVANLVNQWK